MAKEMYKKKFSARAKLLFCLLGPLLFVHRSRCLRRLALHDLYFVCRAHYKYYLELRF